MEETENNSKHLNDLSEIRTLMERSSRFISLSGFSGIFVGIIALFGEWIVISRFKINPVDVYFYDFRGYTEPSLYQFLFFFVDACLVLSSSLGIAIYLAWRKARVNGHSIWDKTARRLFYNMMIPLIVGGFFCLALVYQQLYGLVAPATLIFYGLALFSASKYTLDDIRYLGVMEMALGLFSCFMAQYQLVCWAIGFGLLHIIYGIAIYYKYER